MAPTTRTLYGITLSPDGSPWPIGGEHTAQLKNLSYTAAGTFPTAPITTTNDAQGAWEMDLWCNAEGFKPSKYSLTYPNGDTETFILPAGEGPISIEEIRALGAPPIDWNEMTLQAFWDLFMALLAAVTGSNLVGWAQSQAGAIARTVRDRLRDTLHTADFDTLQHAVDAAVASGQTLVVDSAVTVSASMSVPKGVFLRFDKNGSISVDSGQTLTINGGIQADGHQIFTGAGTVAGAPVVRAVLPEWFGAVATAGTDDTTAITAAITFAAGREVLFKQPLYPARNLSFSDVPIIRLRGKHGATIQHLYDNVLYDETLLTINSPTRIELRGLTFDANETCARCINIVHLTPFEEGENRQISVEDCHFKNGKQWVQGTYPTSGTDRAIGLRVQGYITTLDVIGGSVVNFTSVQPVVLDEDGHQIKGPIARGILCARNTDQGCVLTARIDGVYFDTIGPANDGDAIQYISGEPPVDGALLVTRCRFRNCAKRSVKSQGSSAVVTDNYIYRDVPPYLLGDEDEEGPGCEIAILRGGGIVSHNRAYYEVGCSPPMFVSMTTKVESPTIVEGNLIDAADATEVMERFVNVSAAGTEDNVNVQRGIIVRENVVNLTLDYFCRIRPTAFSANVAYVVDDLLLEKNRSRVLRFGFVSLERSQDSYVRVRGAIRGNSHYGLSVHGVVWRYSGTTFTLTDWKDNRNIKWFSSATNSSDNSGLADADWETFGQTLTISAAGGTYTLSGNSATSSATAYDASAATVQSAIRGLGGRYASAVVTGSGPYTITGLLADTPLLTTNATSLTGGSASAVVTNWQFTGYQYSGSEYEADFLPAQAIYRDYQRETGSAYGVVRFSGTKDANQAITCRVKHDGRGVFNVRAAFHVSVGAGGAYADRAARTEVNVINESTQLLSNNLHNTTSGYAGAWTVVWIDASTFELRKSAGSGSGSSTWWAVVEGTTRPRIDPTSPD